MKELFLLGAIYTETVDFQVCRSVFKSVELTHKNISANVRFFLLDI